MGSLVSELAVLEKVAHPCLLRTYELTHDDKYVYIVTELAQHGDLLKFYREQ